MKDNKAIVITPVKDSINTTIDTARSIINSNTNISYTIFDDFSKEETVAILNEQKRILDFELVHLHEITDNPSPNYKLVLCVSQKKCLEEGKPLIIIESDVTIRPNTINDLLNHLENNPNSGLIGCITVDENEKINFPYLKFSKEKIKNTITKKSISFCCTLISPKLLSRFNFEELNENKNWYDVFLSRKSIELGFENWILIDSPVLHRPHASRPWKNLKYTNPLKYYFIKFWKGLDKI